MDIHISGRGVDLSPGLRRRVETKVAKVARFLPKITEARVVLERERYRHLAEVTLQAKGTTLHAEGAAADF
ncbi:MAG TPA: ribosome-associated translation inhibitor RaiA, partial [Methylomirabilota bacterium]|nr:ribosome-associated translation inhibitor RaiA [Methylomirabilota bacterium]